MPSRNRSITLTFLCFCLGFTATQAQSTARAKVDIAKRGLLPADWGVVIIQEPMWEALHKRSAMQTDSAFTDIQAQVTYVRETYARSATPERLRHTMAHEAGHIHCHCTSEAVANQWAVEHE